MGLLKYVLAHIPDLRDRLVLLQIESRRNATDAALIKNSNERIQNLERSTDNRTEQLRPKETMDRFKTAVQPIAIK